MSANKDYYKVLGVSPDANEAQIKTAYRRLARKFHPDLNPKRRSAERRFKELQEAYAAISSPDTRERHESAGDPPFVTGEVALADSSRFRVAVELNWKRKLALFLWLLCILGLLFPTNFLNESPGLGLIASTIPLLFVWLGDRLADNDSTDVSIGSVLTGAFGNVLMLIGWVIFARLVGGMVIAPIIIMIG